MDKEKEIMKDLIYTMTNRIERLENLVDELVEEKRVTSTRQFDKDKESFRRDLEKLMTI